MKTYKPVIDLTIDHPLFADFIDKLVADNWTARKIAEVVRNPWMFTAEFNRWIWHSKINESQLERSSQNSLAKSSDSP